MFPGDTPYQQRWAASLSNDCPVNVSELTLSPHVGAYADAPLHYEAAGTSVGHLDLTPYLGTCHVVYCIGCGPLVQWAHIQHALVGIPARVLVRTYERMLIDRWGAALAAFAPDTIERLADRGVQLVGIDTASIDPANSKTLDSHQVIQRRGLRVLENLVSEAAKRRVRAGRMLLAGKGCAQVALAVGVARQTVYTWKGLLDDGGIDALRAVPEQGRPPRLDEAQLAQVRAALVQGPTKHGFETELWTLKRVGALVERLHGVRFGQTRVWRLLGRMSFSPQKPDKRAIERDEDAVRHWKRHTWTALKKKPAEKAA